MFQHSRTVQLIPLLVFFIIDGCAQFLLGLECQSTKESALNSYISSFQSRFIRAGLSFISSILLIVHLCRRHTRISNRVIDAILHISHLLSILLSGIEVVAAQSNGSQSEIVARVNAFEVLRELVYFSAFSVGIGINRSELTTNAQSLIVLVQIAARDIFVFALLFLSLEELFMKMDFPTLPTSALIFAGIYIGAQAFLWNSNAKKKKYFMQSSQKPTTILVNAGTARSSLDLNGDRILFNQSGEIRSQQLNQQQSASQSLSIQQQQQQQNNSQNRNFVGENSFRIPMKFQADNSIDGNIVKTLQQTQQQQQFTQFNQSAEYSFLPLKHQKQQKLKQQQLQQKQMQESQNHQWTLPVISSYQTPQNKSVGGGGFIEASQIHSLVNMPIDESSLTPADSRLNLQQKLKKNHHHMQVSCDDLDVIENEMIEFQSQITFQQSLRMNQLQQSSAFSQQQKQHIVAGGNWESIMKKQEKQLSQLKNQQQQTAKQQYQQTQKSPATPQKKYFKRKNRRDVLLNHIKRRLELMHRSIMQNSVGGTTHRNHDSETVPTFMCFPTNTNTNTMNMNNTSLKSVDESPVFKVLENLSLGLMCYDIDMQSISFSNRHIRELFSLSEDKEVFEKMMGLRNYLLKDSHQEGGRGGQMQQMTSRNIDMVPGDMFSHDFRTFQTISQQPTSEFVRATTIIQNNTINTNNNNNNNNNTTLSNHVITKQSSQGIPASATAVSISLQALNDLEHSIHGKNPFTTSLYQRTPDSNGNLSRIVYSNFGTLRLQFAELVGQMKGDIPTIEEPSKIRFMCQLQGSTNWKLTKASEQKVGTTVTSKERILQITLTPLLHGYRSHVLISVEDVTHFNQIKVLESLNKNKSFMLSQVSHEIRNPISCIIAMLEEIQLNIEDKMMVMDCATTALQSSRLLLNLLNDLLDMSQVKAGKFKLVLEQFNVLELLEEVKKMMQPLAKNKSNTIHVVSEIDPTRFASIVSDRYRLRQILINLISNSIKYTQKGNIYLRVEVEKADERYLRIAVRDEGIGIKKEFRQNLFQAFGVAEDQESKAKNNPNGVGLGLLISNTIAKNLKPSTAQSSSSTASSMIISSKVNIKSVQVSSPGRIGSKSLISSGPQRRNTVVQFQPQPPFLIDDGLLLNEAIEVGSEFYFTIFNYSPNCQSSLQQQQQQQQQQGGVGSSLASAVVSVSSSNETIGYTQKMRNASVSKRHTSIFAHDEMIMQTHETTSSMISGFVGSPKGTAAALVMMMNSRLTTNVVEQVNEEEDDDMYSDEPIPTEGSSDGSHAAGPGGIRRKGTKGITAAENRRTKNGLYDQDDDDEWSGGEGIYSENQSSNMLQQQNNKSGGFMAEKKFKKVVSQQSEDGSSFVGKQKMSSMGGSSEQQLMQLQTQHQHHKISGSMYKNGAEHNFQATISNQIRRRNEYRCFLDVVIEILIVDDDQFSALALRSKITAAFRQFNKNIAISFTTLFSGDDCVQELLKKEKAYQFLFIDSQMPGLDGFETVRMIDMNNLRENPNPACENDQCYQNGNSANWGNAPGVGSATHLNKAATTTTGVFKQLEIVLCSGMLTEDRKMQMHQINHFLLKPVELKPLLEIISEVFEDNEFEFDYK